MCNEKSIQEMASNTFPLSGYGFIASPQMNNFYVIQNDTKTAMATIVASFPLDDPEAPGLSLQLIGSSVDDYQLTISAGNVFGDIDTLEVVRVGRVVVETKSSMEGDTLKRLVAYFNGAMVDTANRTLTAAGIGITDILSADPLTVSLVNAPLDVLESASGAPRKVAGILVEYLDFVETTYTGTNISKIWGILIVLEPAPQ